MQKNEYLIKLMKEFIELKNNLEIVEKRLWNSEHSKIRSILIGNSMGRVNIRKEFNLLIRDLENGCENSTRPPEDIEIAINSFERQLKKYL